MVAGMGVLKLEQHFSKECTERKDPANLIYLFSMKGVCFISLKVNVLIIQKKPGKRLAIQIC